MVPVISLDPLGRPKEARLSSARQEGPRAREQRPGCLFSYHSTRPLVRAKTALSEVDWRVPRGLCCGPRTECLPRSAWLTSKVASWSMCVLLRYGKQGWFCRCADSFSLWP